MVLFLFVCFGMFFVTTFDDCVCGSLSGFAD